MDQNQEYRTQATPPDASNMPPPPPPPPGPQPVYSRRDLPLKSTAFAVVLSAIIPGIGQAYVGYYRAAFTTIVVFASLVAVLASNAVRGLEPLFGIFIGFFYVYQIVDAGRRASLFNRVVETGRSAPLPEDFRMPEAGGSMFGGVSLLVIGGLALMNTVFDVDLDWLEDWWPLALIAVGIWLIYRARQEKRLG